MRRNGRSIFLSAFAIGALTAVVHVVTLIKELVVAHQFGTGDALDAFLIAYLLPSVASVFVAGSFGSSFMPTYIHVRERDGTEAADRFYASAYLLLVLVLAFAMLLCLVLLPAMLPWIAGGFPPAKKDLTLSLAWIVVPTLFTSGIATVWTTLLNASHRFAAGALAPILLPAVMIAFVWAQQPADAHALAWGALVGSGLQMAILGWIARRDGIALIPRWHGLSPEIRETLAQYGPMILGALLMSATTVVDQVMAARLHPGDVAALSYGGKIVSLFAAVVAMAMATAVMPVLSRQLATNDFTGVRAALRDVSRTLMIVTVAATVVVVALSDWLVSMLFERGAFGASDTTLVSWIQQLAALQIPFYALGMIFVRLLSALRRNDVLATGSAISLVLKVGLNVLLIPSLGVAGIALATSIMYAFALVYLSLRSMAVLRNRTHDARDAAGA